MLKEAKEFKKKILEEKSYENIRNAIDMYRSFSPTGGAKEKLILSYNEKKDIFYLGSAKKGDKSLIVKIDESEYPKYGAKSIIEYLYSKVAVKCGIKMTSTYLFEDTLGFKHFAIERFDITDNNTRLHTHTLSGLLHLEKSTPIDYKNILALAKQQLMVPQEDLEEIYRRMVFNYIYNNNDDHMKNTTFLMNKEGKWRLSPAYDLTYNNTNAQRDMILKINGKLSSNVTYDDFAQIGREFEVSYDAIINDIQASKIYFNELLDEYKNNNIKFDLLEIAQTRSVFPP